MTDEAGFIGQAHNFSRSQVNQVGMLAAHCFDGRIDRSKIAFVEIVIAEDKINGARKSRQESQSVFDPPGIGNVAGYEEGVGLFSGNLGNKGPDHFVSGKFKMRIADPDEFHVIKGVWEMLVPG
jgi:hypothetical protein